VRISASTFAVVADSGAGCTGGFQTCPHAATSAERAKQKARRGFRPGFLDSIAKLRFFAFVAVQVK
jgi:hypothetical protein